MNIAKTKEKTKIIVLWANDDTEENFTTDPPEMIGTVKKIYCFDSPEEFIEYFKTVRAAPVSMWYWVIAVNGDETECICSGACDYDDYDIFVEYFEK